MTRHQELELQGTLPHSLFEKNLLALVPEEARAQDQ